MTFGYAELWPVHAVLMGTGFVLMVIAMLCTFFLKKKKWWFKAHKTLSVIGGVLSVTALAVAVYMISSSYGLHFASLHGVLGLITLILIVMSPFLGFGMQKVKARRKKAFRTLHVWTSRGALVLMLIVIVMGLRLAGIL